MVDQDARFVNAWREGVLSDGLVVVPYIFQILEGALVQPVQVPIFVEEGLVGYKVMVPDLDL